MSLIDEYYTWLFSLVDGNEEEYKDYKLMFRYLCSYKFFSSHPMDDNRAMDGAHLRNRFAEECGYSYLEVNDVMNGYCSVAEMLIALAMRIDSEVVGNQIKGNRQADWFWRMVKNLRLYPEFKGYLNPSQVMKIDSILWTWLSRNFDEDGFGSIFPLRNPPGNERDTEIWYQMQAWVNENFPV